MLLSLNLMTAVYWGQMSHCTIIRSTVAQYSCSNPTAYGAVSAFASLLFIAQTALVAIIVLWRAELIQEVTSYVGVSKEEDLTTMNFRNPVRQQADF